MTIRNVNTFMYIVRMDNKVCGDYKLTIVITTNCNCKQNEQQSIETLLPEKKDRLPYIN